MLALFVFVVRFAVTARVFVLITCVISKEQAILTLHVFFFTQSVNSYLLLSQILQNYLFLSRLKT